MQFPLLPIYLCKHEQKVMFYAELESVKDGDPICDTLTVWSDCNSTTSKESCLLLWLFLGPRRFRTKYINTLLLLNFVKSRKLRIAGFWFKRSVPCSLNCYINAAGVAKEIDHIFVRTRRILLESGKGARYFHLRLSLRMFYASILYFFHNYRSK